MASSVSASISGSLSSSSCSVRISTVIKKIDSVVPNQENASIIHSFHMYMKEKDSSENHQVNNLKVVIDLAKCLGVTNFYQIDKREQIISFLNKRIKTVEVDPDKKWITTWNHYLNRTKLFFRWLHNWYLKQEQDVVDNAEWITPEFCRIKMKTEKL